MNNIKAYSYIRFSTPEQGKGNSLERQTQGARDYANAHGLHLDEALKFQDEGISAFKGQHYNGGKLAAFVAACDAGTVARGSFLLVENLDRLSRQKPIEAVGQLQEILRRGVTVVTLFDGEVFPPDALEDFGKLLKAVVVMQTAHEESEKKSHRIAASWKSKRRDAAAKLLPMTAMAPGWLTLRDKRYEVIEDRAAVVRDIFKLTIGGEGKGRIAKRLNEAGVAPFGQARGWLPSSVQKVLENEAVVGRYQPHRVVVTETGTKNRVPEGEVIEGYFPPILDETTFLRARVVRHERRIPSGPRGTRLSNLFTGIATCAHCGGPMHFENKGEGYTRLVCGNAKRGAVVHAANSWPYKIVERFGLLALHTSLDFNAILPGVEADHLNESLREIEGQLIVARDTVERAGKAVATMLDLLETSNLPDYRERMVQRSREKAEAELEAKRLGATADVIRVTIAERTRDKLTTDEALRQWAVISEGSDIDEAYRVRLALQQLLKRNFVNVALNRAVQGDLDYGLMTTNTRSGAAFQISLSDQNEDGSLQAGAYSFSSPGADGVASMAAADRIEVPEWWPM